MRRTIGIAAIALGLLVGNVTVASATTSEDAATRSTGSNDRTETLRFTIRNVAIAELDLGTAGRSLGDQFISTGNVFRGSARVGEAHIVCTVVRLVSATSTTEHCAGALVLPGGQITGEGANTFTQESTGVTVAVTGGTGRYRTARGEVRSRLISETEEELTVHLIR
jgi:hypothetical protein